MQRRTAEQAELWHSDAVQTCRSLTAQLSPTILYDAGFIPAIDWLGRRMHELHGLSVRILAEPLDPEPRERLSVFYYQAIRELLFNVSKHTGVDAATVRIWRKNSRLYVSVEDFGVGFDPREAERNRDEKSFGLFSIRERVSAMNGTFEISSERGHTLIMLAMDEVWDADESPAPEKDELAVSREPEAAMSPVRVVLVDDHQVLRDALKSHLRQIPGVTIVGEASDGQTAVELVRGVKPDIVVMDVMMPGMDGIEATRQIRQTNPRVVVIGLSMYDERHMVDKMIKAGAARYLSKTASFDELKNTILEVRLALSREQDSPAEDGED